MIEINLAPRGSGGARGSRSTPGGSPSGRASPWHLAASVPGLAGLLALALLHPRARDRQRVVEGRLAEALRDSTELAALISATEQLRAGRDSVAARMRVIEELDRGRYVWSHILDDVAAAVPESTWLTRIGRVGAYDRATTGDPLRVEIEGRTINTLSLTRFMNRLEASPFLSSVSLAGTEQVAERMPEGGDRVLSSFVLSATYGPPPESPSGPVSSEVNTNGRSPEDPT